MPEEWREPRVTDADRLPWLETVDQEYREGPAVGRILALAVIGVLVVLAVVFAARWLHNRPSADGGGAMIAAQEGDYKVRPDTPGGTNVTGEGDSAMAASQGADNSNAAINLNAVPEAPIAGKKAGAPSIEGGKRSTVAALPESGGKLGAPSATHAAVNDGASGGSLVQIGSFPSEAAANAAWARQAKRFSYLADLGKSVQKAEVGGATVYRLRVNAGSTAGASELCGKLKVAGEACYIARD